ncbi:hypothetical protein CC99x_008005 [Candidatus Berkiella cookevillensis]|uniref:Leucine Rich repeats (2 copies) n=1 Tax=Candidatus Berkiella cookevillensis TaxID=437022 RepID=A0A0Q9YRX8_9GAMM|nr:hypothetical protein [Candidatus Berkiella cookevillensis]MCS5708847.1 hypothetical protein [Candidatus Berkiella cookevillensis]
MISQAPQKNLATKLNLIWNNNTVITEQALYDLLVLTSLNHESMTLSGESIFAASMPELISYGKQPLEKAALDLLGQFIIQTQDAILLEKLAQRMLETADTQNIFTSLKATSCTKLAWVNIEFSKQYNNYLLETLSLDELKWLSIVIDSGQYISQIGKQDHKLTAPLPSNAYFENINRTLTLAQANSEIRAYLSATIKSKLMALSTPKADYVRESEDLVNLVTETQIRAEFYPFARAHMTWIKGYAASIGQAFASEEPTFLEWALVTLSTGNSEYKAYQPSAEEYATLQSWINSYGRGYLIDTLDLYLSKRAITTPHDAVSGYYDNAVQSLDLNSKRWLLLELAFKNFPQINETGIQQPTQEQLAICKQLIENTNGCTSLWRNLQEKLIQNIGPQLKETFSIISATLFAIASELPDEARLWLYLAIMTNTKPQFFDLTNIHYHEQLSNTAIRQIITSDITDHFIFLASCSDMMRSIIKAALTQKDNAPDFAQKVKTLPLYQKSFTENELKRLDENAKHWLLYALCFNNVVTKATAISSTLNITVPSGRLFEHVNIMLNQAQMSSEQRAMYIEQLVQGLSYSAHDAFGSVVQNFINITIDTLNEDEQAWLFLCLHQKNCNIQSADFNKQFPKPTEKLSAVTRILYLLSMFPSKIAITTQHLKEKNAMLGYFEPTLLDALGLVTNQYIEVCEMANLACMDERQSTRFAFILSQALPAPIKIWMAANLERGVVDASLMFMMISQNKIPPHIAMPLLHNATSLLLLALKWPNLKEIIIEKFGGNKNSIKPITAINVNNMPLGDVGMSMLCEILSTQSDALMAFSAQGTGITDRGLLSFSQKLLAKASLEIIDFGKNDISIECLSMLFENPLLKENPQYLIRLVSAILSDLQHPDVIIYLASHLLLKDVLTDKIPSQDTLAFYKKPEFTNALQKADFLLSQGENIPLVENMLNTITQSIPAIVLDTQLIHAALSAKDTSIVSAVLFHVMDNITNPSTIEWIKTCLESGEIHLPNMGGADAKQGDVLQMLQSASLMLALNQDLRQKLYQTLGGDHGQLLPPIRTINIQNCKIPEDLQAVLCLGLDSNLDTLQNLQFKAMGLSNQTLERICRSTHSHLTMKSLDIGGHTMTSDTLNAVCEALEKGHIQNLDLSECAINSEMLNTVIGALLNSNVHHLKAQNKLTDIENSASQISDFAAKSIAQFLANPNCPLVSLDLSHNKISALGLHYITSAITSNPASKLETLCLNHQLSMGDAFIKQIGALIAHPTQLKQIEINGHTAKKEALELLIPALAKNTCLQKLCIHPKQDMSSETDSEIEKILQTIKTMIAQNSQLSVMTSDLKQLKLERSDSSSSDNAEIDVLINDLGKQLVFSKAKSQSSETLRISGDIVTAHDFSGRRQASSNRSVHKST